MRPRKGGLEIHGMTDDGREFRTMIRPESTIDKAFMYLWLGLGLLNLLIAAAKLAVGEGWDVSSALTASALLFLAYESYERLRLEDAVRNLLNTMKPERKL